jgi:large subunit ribosomal protein L3
MAGRTGNARVKVVNLRVVKVLADNNLLLVSGAIPGANNSYVLLEK